MNRTIILVAGGDLRYGYTAQALAANDAYEVWAAGIPKKFLPDERIHLVESAADGLPMCDVLLLPMPVSEDGVLVNAPFSRRHLPLQGFIPKVREGGLVLGGKFGKAQAVFQQAGLETVDYLAREELSMRNAVPTAEGAVQIMLEEMPRTIFGSRVLLLGFGRIGARMAMLLKAFGAQVTVAARDPAARAGAEMLGCRSIPFTALQEAALQADVICNTVPAKIITESVLKAIQQETLVLDLASKPGGVDWDAAQELGRQVVWALSLPGKTAPVTAGEIIAVTVAHILEERRTAHGET
ncbi:MAG: dipicolinate synthase subunit DpsA [Oscillospiraceae bacterium]|nr:dipicolinate synthase subunit DpsA [Oscillospiraceae bacterium]